LSSQVTESHSAYKIDDTPRPLGHGLNIWDSLNAIVEYELLSENILVFFGFVLLISMSGVMTPGPVFAAAVAKGYKDRGAGVKIALGHGLIEFPLIALIALIGIGASEFLEDPWVGFAIGVVGGSLLLFLGVGMIRSRRVMAVESERHLPYGATVSGALTTSANPYFFLWWATVGALLVFNAQWFGPIVVVVFAVVHWSCDLAWYSFTSYTVNRTKHLWTPMVHQVIFGTCGLLMVVFGVYFIVGPTYELAT
jgi:threonine/homoserine/homoserine lactone efflux protein